MTRTLFVPALLILALAPAAGAQSPGAADGRDADRAAIKAHIEGICQAFLDRDIDRIHATHTEDWRGFLEHSRTPIKGIDEYMRASNELPNMARSLVEAGGREIAQSFLTTKADTYAPQPL